MNLVGYSDSEGSDSETARPPSKPATRPTAKAAPKLVNPGSNKVKVNLSNLTSGGDTEAEQDGRPAKRQRIGGGLNINAFLPPPKQPSKPLANEANFAAKKTAGKGLGRGVNLKTGAEPAFMRSEASSSLDLDGEPKDIKEVIAELRRSRLPASSDVGAINPGAKEASPTVDKEVKLVGNPMRFKPKSVARGPHKKKITTAAAPAIPALAATPVNATPSSPAEATNPPVVSARGPSIKAKVSLFFLGKDNSTNTAQSSAGEGEPALDEDTNMAEVPDEAFSTYAQAPSDQTYDPPAATASSASAVSGLNLSAAEMRQLFGRKAGKGGQMPDIGAIKVVNFNADDQYAANEELRAKGETVQHNPVRGLAPGKHSLKQLVNAAATQKDALEEHFAQGKRNQREAGSRYGW